MYFLICGLFYANLFTFAFYIYSFSDLPHHTALVLACWDASKVGYILDIYNLGPLFFPSPITASFIKYNECSLDENKVL